MRHEKRIEIRWRDLDALGHVNNAVYATYLEECRDEWVIRALGGVGDPWEWVVVRVAIDFRSELTQEDDVVIVSVALVRIGTSSLTLREEIRKLDGTLSAEAEAVIVARSRETGRSRPLTDAERDAMTAVLAPASESDASYKL
jgi:acyl-CoA thioester hydrolase